MRPEALRPSDLAAGISALFLALALLFVLSGGGGGIQGLAAGAGLGLLLHAAVLALVLQAPSRAWVRLGGYAWGVLGLIADLAMLFGHDPFVGVLIGALALVAAAWWLTGLSMEMRGLLLPIGLLVAALWLLTFGAAFLRLDAARDVQPWAQLAGQVVAAIWFALLAKRLAHSPGVPTTPESGPLLR